MMKFDQVLFHEQLIGGESRLVLEPFLGILQANIPEIGSTSTLNHRLIVVCVWSNDGITWDNPKIQKVYIPEN